MNDKHLNEDLIAGYTAYVTPAEIAADHSDQAPAATPSAAATIFAVTVGAAGTTVSFTC
ncbi:LxmA leader domain family RiPP [Streptomyces sp. NPDC001652]|uniref:LxmA leader domain family RiPP n=1 Tax=Streptomyces sp. NPDC001652 TaxID=3154393 RepID=UPI0033214A93